MSAEDITRALADSVPDQGQIFDTDGIVDLGTDDWSQSITTGIAGQLTGIQIQFDSSAPLPGDFDFSVFDDGNPPTGPVLFSQQLTITSADLVSPRLYTWDVTGGNLFFDAGEVFTFALSAQQTGFVIAGNDGPGYPGGELFKNGSALPSTEVNDIAFISYVVPQPAADFNNDGLVDCLDVDSLVAEIVAGTHSGDFDLTGDGLVNNLDLNEWLVQGGAVNLPSGNPYLVGDADLNGFVDGQDFIRWNANKFTMTAAWCSGDFNADGTVDGQDFILWNDNKFTSSGGVSAVPEPSGGLLSFVVLILLGSTRRLR